VQCGRALGKLDALRPWPNGLPVYAVAGDYHLVLPLLLSKRLVRIDVGDLIVLAPSAGAGATVPPASARRCSDAVIATVLQSACFHSNLAKHPGIASHVVELVRGGGLRTEGCPAHTDIWEPYAACHDSQPSSDTTPPLRQHV
jgi:hypothetical protein